MGSSIVFLPYNSFHLHLTYERASLWAVESKYAHTTKRSLRWSQKAARVGDTHQLCLKLRVACQDKEVRKRACLFCWQKGNGSRKACFLNQRFSLGKYCAEISSNSFATLSHYLSCDVEKTRWHANFGKNKQTKKQVILWEESAVFKMKTIRI